jgi:adenylate cyclase
MREPPRVLIVDDNPANLEIMEARLARQGYEVITATDGDAALVTARAQTPDLILLDVMMPGKDGIEVCRELKADPSLPFMPVILVTARSDPDDVVAGLDAGGDEYVTKPVDHAALIARVRSILPSRPCTTRSRSRRPSSRSGTGPSSSGSRPNSASCSAWVRSSGSSHLRWPSS